MYRQLQLAHAHAHCEVSGLAALHHHVFLAPWVRCKEALLAAYISRLTPTEHFSLSSVYGSAGSGTDDTAAHLSSCSQPAGHLPILSNSRITPRDAPRW